MSKFILPCNASCLQTAKLWNTVLPKNVLPSNGTIRIKILEYYDIKNSVYNNYMKIIRIIKKKIYDIE